MVSKKISFLIPSISQGGIERIFIQVSNYIIKNSLYKVEFFLNGSKYSKNNLLNEKIKVISYNDISYKKYLFYLIKYYNSSKPDIIFSSLYIIGFVAIIARIFSSHKPKIIFGAHNALSYKISNPDNNKDKYILKFLSKFFLNKADLVVSASNGVGRELIEKFNLNKKKIVTISGPTHNKSEINKLLLEECRHKFFKLKNHKILICVGRLSPQKGHEILLKSFHLFKKKYKSKLIIIGDGSEKKKLVNMTKKLGLVNDVSFMGSQNNPYKFLSKADLFVSASKWEGLSLVILEALYTGTNVVATDCKYGPSEILKSGKFGTLTKVNSVKSLYRGMLANIMKPKSIQSKIKNKNRAENFFKSNSNQEYLKIINKYLSSN